MHRQAGDITFAFRRCQAEILCQPNTLRESDNNHRAGGSGGGGEAARAAGICHRLRSRTHSKDNTENWLVRGIRGLECITTTGLKTNTDGGFNGQQQSPMGQCWEKWTEQTTQYVCSREVHQFRIFQPVPLVTGSLSYTTNCMILEISHCFYSHPLNDIHAATNVTQKQLKPPRKAM